MYFEGKLDQLDVRVEEMEKSMFASGARSPVLCCTLESLGKLSRISIPTSYLGTNKSQCLGPGSQALKPLKIPGGSAVQPRWKTTAWTRDYLWEMPSEAGRKLGEWGILEAERRGCARVIVVSGINAVEPLSPGLRRGSWEHAAVSVE